VHGSALWARVEAVYGTAQASGVATKTDTKVCLLPDPSLGGAEFVVRLATALKKKPQGSAAKPATKRHASPNPPPNPFLPYEEALWVAHLSDTHTCVLNKFNVVPYHSLVVTRKFESQGDPLNAQDLAGASALLGAMPFGGIAFYNCGPESGRSQPHKHMQVVPLPLHEGAVGANVLRPPLLALALAAVDAASGSAGSAVPVRIMPYACYAARIDAVSVGGDSPGALEATFQALLQSAFHGAHAPSPSDPPPSYNVVMSREVMLLVPRRSETVGPLAIKDPFLER
ncbi:hypothetical protein FOA52_007125, partial [Chlamydomonas sp. UWO 241]